MSPLSQGRELKYKDETDVHSILSRPSRRGVN